MDWVEADEDQVAGDALLLRELNHRVSVHLRITQAALHHACGAGECAQGLSAAIASLDAFRAVHEMLSRAWPEDGCVGLTLERLCAAWSRAAPLSPRVEVELPLAEVLVSRQVARKVAMIVAELLANAFRHAFPGRDGTVNVSVRHCPGGFVVAVRDDGRGMARDECGSGSGLALTDALARSLGGTLALRSDEGGTTVLVRVPTRPKPSSADV